MSFSVWTITNRATGEPLGHHMRADELPVFGGRRPMYWSELRYAREAWLSYCVRAGYLRRGVTMPGKGKVYHPGPNAEFWPEVDFVRVSMVEVERKPAGTPEDMGIKYEAA
jgi:hypothetical protein